MGTPQKNTQDDMTENLYFRIKDNGATVFRVEDENRQRRMDFQPIAEANTRNGDIKPRKDANLSDAENAEITNWIEMRRAALRERETTNAQLTLEQINASANWFSGKPDIPTAEAFADDMLLALHDLRSAIVRFKSKNMTDD
ncbi:MAG: hypothetical protein ACPGFA_13555 [Pikeienuella sp.]